jgi:hypothetical protein
MTRQLPAGDEVRRTMHLVLKEAENHGRHPTISAVERRLGIPHPTFYRNFPELIEWFKQQRTTAPVTSAVSEEREHKRPDEVMSRLRRENADLRKLVKIYAEAIRQLTVETETLASEAARAASITPLRQK